LKVGIDRNEQLTVMIDHDTHEFVKRHARLARRTKSTWVLMLIEAERDRLQGQAQPSDYSMLFPELVKDGGSE